MNTGSMVGGGEGGDVVLFSRLGGRTGMLVIFSLRPETLETRTRQIAGG